MTLAADQYFADHLDNNFWGGLTPETKAAALSMAESDITAILVDGFSVVFAEKAIYEQAVYLARNYETQTAGKITTSETLGPMSESFTLIGADHPGISHRAMLFVKKANASSLGGSVIISRG